MTTWQVHFHAALPRLGHRNWIVISDAAYPQQASKGVEVILADVAVDDCLKYVLKSIEEAGHITPKVLLDTELSVLTDDLCPGVTALRDSIQFEASSLPVDMAAHDIILEKINMEGADYSVLVIKTTTMIPYTSVFLRLECGYWDKDREAIMRGRL
ncbi:MAG: hypothetical protein JST51_07320 [Armatimonadetes bacterium]|nr:hypothetical protein [Armatimonadota bacterium]